MNFKKATFIGILSLSLLAPSVIYAQNGNSDQLSQVPSIGFSNNSHWAYRNLYFANQIGYIDMKNNNFDPNQAMTKYQFIKILMKFDEYEGYLPQITHIKEATLPYKDVSFDSEYYNVVLQAYDHGLLSNQINFNGNEIITREEATDIIAKFYSSVVINKPINTSSESIFTDQSTISSQYLNSILYLDKLGIVNGRKNKKEEIEFQPKTNITIAETVTLVLNLRTSFHKNNLQLHIISVQNGITFYSYNYARYNVKYTGFDAKFNNELDDTKLISIGYVEETNNGYNIYYQIKDKDIGHGISSSIGSGTSKGYSENIGESYNTGIGTSIGNSVSKGIGKSEGYSENIGKSYSTGKSTSIGNGVSKGLGKSEENSESTSIGSSGDYSQPVGHSSNDDGTIVSFYDMIENKYNALSTNFSKPFSNNIKVLESTRYVIFKNEDNNDGVTFTAENKDGKLSVQGFLGEKPNNGYGITIDSVNVNEDSKSIYVLYHLQLPLENAIYAQLINYPKSNVFFINSEISSDVLLNYGFEMYPTLSKKIEKIDDVTFTYYKMSDNIIVNAQMDEKQTTGYDIKINGFKIKDNTLTTYYNQTSPNSDDVNAQIINSPSYTTLYEFDKEKLNNDLKLEFKKYNNNTSELFSNIMEKVVNKSKNIYSYQGNASSKGTINDEITFAYNHDFKGDNYNSYIKDHSIDNNAIFEVYVTNNKSEYFKNGVNNTEDFTNVDFSNFDYAEIIPLISDINNYYNINVKEDSDYYYIGTEPKIDDSYNIDDESRIIDGNITYKINKKTNFIEQLVITKIGNDNIINKLTISYHDFNKTIQIQSPSTVKK